MIAYAWGTKGDRGTSHNAQATWEAFANRLAKEPPRGLETMAQFAAMPKERRDALKLANWYVGGPSVDGERSATSFPMRTMLTLDIDDATPAFVAALRKGNGTAYLAHTTRSSTPDKPRLRLIMPLREPITAELHTRVVLGLASKIERMPGVLVDRCSTDANRLLYAPTLSADAPHVAIVQPGAFPDVAALAALAPAPVVKHAPAHSVGRVADWRMILEELGARIEPSPRYAGEYTTLCVWHSESHPSLDITPENGKMYCWSCQRGGTAVSYVMEVLGCTPKEAGRFMRSVTG